MTRLDRPQAPLTLATTMAAVLLAAVPARAQATFPAGFTYETVVPGLNQATAIAFAGPGRLLIAQKAGVVRVATLQGSTWTLLSTPFVNLSDTNAALDRGLLAIAVHPDFPQTPFVYLYHTFNPPGLPGSAQVNGARLSRVLRLTADAGQNFNVASTAPDARVVLLGGNGSAATVGDPSTPDSRTLYACQGAPSDPYLEDCLPADSDNHAGADLKFGPDGMLYVATGDATPPNGNPRAIRSQDLGSLAGKVLRVHPLTGDGLSDNPFFDGNVSSNRSRVFAYGLRNPFRMAFQPSSGLLFIGDVGWNEWEELDVGRGRNFGWPCYEGGNGTSVRQTAYASLARCATLYAQGTGAVQAPIHGYAHNGAGASIIVGTFYNGTVFPAQYRGALFFYDFNLTWIRTAQVTATSATVSGFATNAGNNNDYTNGITQMVDGPDGALYSANLSTVRRIRFSAGNAPPVATIAASPTSGPVPLTVAFSGTGSRDPEGGQLTFAWTFGDGGTSTAASPSHTYQSAGTFTARLTVRDPQGATGTATVTVQPGNTAPVVTMAAPAAGTAFAVGDTIAFSGSAMDAQSGNLSASLRWEVLLHHNDHVHFDVFSATGPGGSFQVADHGETNWSLEICATATDPQALSTRVCRALLPRTVAFSFDTVPSGLQVTVGGTARTTPFTVPAILNSNLLIAAAAAQGTFQFVSWSDGGSASHTVLVGDTPQSFVATYRSAPTLPFGQRRSFQAATLTGNYVHHRSGSAFADPISAGSSAADKQAATFTLVPGLDTSRAGCVSFRAVGSTTQFLRHFGFRILLQANDGSAIFRADATFCPQSGLLGSGLSFESVNFPGRFLRRRNLELWIDPQETTAAYRGEATFNMVAPWTPVVAPGRRSFQARNFTDRYVHHRSGAGFIDPITAASSTADKQAATFEVVAALDAARIGCVSFRSVTSTTSFLRHSGFRVVLQANDGSAGFRADATFCPRDGLAGAGVSFEAASAPGRFVRHRNFELWVDPQATDALYIADASFNVVAPWAP